MEARATETRAQVLRRRIDQAIELLEYPTASWSETVLEVLDVLKGTVEE